MFSSGGIMINSIEVVASCHQCGGQIIARNSAAANLLRSGRKAICDDCLRAGRQWTRATYADYLKSAHWQETRYKAIQRAGQKCQVCASTDRLDVHHNNYSRLGGELPTDLVVLCRPCHELFHEVMP